MGSRSQAGVRVVLGVCLVALISAAGVWAGAAKAPPNARPPKEVTLTGPGVQLHAVGLPTAYARAMLNVTSAARRIYADTLHCDVPETVQVDVTCDSSRRTALWNDGESQVFLVLRSTDDLAPPARSGYFQLYGLCHELGHMTMYRRIRVLGLPAGIGEGWAHYAGSVVTDQVYAQLGQKAWPIPYDYRADGLARLSKQAKGGSSDATTKAAAAFCRAHVKYGPAKVMAAMTEGTTGKPYGREVMPRFVAVLVKSTGDEAARDLFPAELLAPKVEWQTAQRQITAQSTAGVTSTPDATGVLLKYDVDHSDGMRSTAGAGHAVVFARPAGEWAVEAVEMYGSRYGEDTPPADNWSIFLCDQDFNVLKEIQEPYAKLEQSDPKWYHFDFDPVTVPEGFYVCVFFDPTATKGFYMHYEKGHATKHSRAALPYTFVADVDYDWMIRVHLRKPSG
jgi:hypothetical protein